MLFALNRLIYCCLLLTITWRSMIIERWMRKRRRDRRRGLFLLPVLNVLWKSCLFTLFVIFNWDWTPKATERNRILECFNWLDRGYYLSFCRWYAHDRKQMIILREFQAIYRHTCFKFSGKTMQHNTVLKGENMALLLLCIKKLTVLSFMFCYVLYHDCNYYQMHRWVDSDWLSMFLLFISWNLF